MFFSFHHKFLFHISNFFNIIILVPHPDSIGNAAEEIYYATLKARREKKKLAIIFVKKIPFFLDYLGFYDTDFFSLKSKYFLFSHNSFSQHLCGLFFSLYFVLAKIINSLLSKFFKKKKSGYYWRPMAGNDILWRPNSKLSKFDIKKSKKQNWSSQFQKHLDIDITEKSLLKCRKIIKDLGYEDREFVCIHVREGGYKDDHSSNLLNLNISNFIKGIKEICSRNILVFRLGDPSMKRLPKIDNLIDYSFADYKSADMDNYLIKNCKFLICGPSGPYCSARFIHRKRTLFHNMFNVFEGPFNEGDIALIRPMYSKSKKRYLSIKEMMIYSKELKSSWIGNDWIMKENNENEIYEAIREMLDSEFSSPSTLQKKFRKNSLKVGLLLLNNLRFQEEHLDNVNDKYRFASRIRWKGKISESFLTNNWERSSRNKNLHDIS